MFPDVGETNDVWWPYENAFINLASCYSNSSRLALKARVEREVFKLHFSIAHDGANIFLYFSTPERELTYISIYETIFFKVQTCLYGNVRSVKVSMLISAEKTACLSYYNCYILRICVYICIHL